MRFFGNIKLIGFIVNNLKYNHRFNTRMPYCSTGAVHHSGVGNEKDMVSLLNANPFMNINQHIISRVHSTEPNIPKWAHLGGTQQKADCDVKIGDTCFDVSIKHHEKSAGTFDWINRSKLKDFNPEIADLIKPRVGEFKEKHKDAKEVSKEMRSEMEDVFNGAFEHITSVQIKSLLDALYLKYPQYVLINDRSKGRFVMYHKEHNFKEFVGYNEWEYYLKSSGRAKTSRMVWRRKDGVEENTNLRIRLVLNNGVNALLGLSEKNKNSYPCLKIQQDRVDIILKNLVDPIIDEISKQEDQPNLEMLTNVVANEIAP